MILQKLKADAEAYLGDDRDGGGDHRPGVLQRLAAAGDEGRGQDRGPRSAAHHQRADGGGAGVRPGQEGRRRRSRCTTWAAARSTSRSWSWAKARSR